MRARKFALSNGLFATCDEDDYEFLSCMRWCVKLTAYSRAEPMAYCRLEAGPGHFRSISMSHFVVITDQSVSPRNGDYLDVRKRNLRVGARNYRCGGGAPRHLTEDQKVEMLALLLFHSDRETARRMGRSAKGIGLQRRKLGLPAHDPRAKRANDNAIAYIKSHPELSNRALGKHLGISNVAVVYAKRRLGIDPLPVGRPRAS